MDNKLKFQSSGVSIKDADVYYGKNHVIKNISIDICLLYTSPSPRDRG